MDTSLTINSTNSSSSMVESGLKDIFVALTALVKEQLPGGERRPDIFSLLLLLEVSWVLELGWPIALLVALALPALIWLISIIYTHPGHSQGLVH